MYRQLKLFTLILFDYGVRETRYSNTGVRAVMCILAAIVILVVGSNVVDIFFAGVEPGIIPAPQ